MDRRKAVIYLVITVVLWSTSGLMIKVLDWHPLAVSGIRSAIAAATIWLYLRRPRFVWSVALIGGAIAYLGAQTLFVVATTLTSAANAIFLQYTAPVWVALFGIWYLGERARAIDWWTMGIIFLGMALFFGDALSPQGIQGNILAIIGGVTFAWLILFMRKQKDGTPESIVLLGNILCMLVGLPVVVMAWQAGTLPGAQSWAILLFLGVLQLGIPYLLYARSIRHLSALEAVLIQTLEPILNPIWVFLVISERPGPWSLAGAAVVLVAVTVRALIIAQGERPPHQQPEPADLKEPPMPARKIVLIGAGSASFTQGLVADMILTGEPWDIHLVDIHPENLAVAHGVVQRMLQARPSPITVTATADRRAALLGADAVVTTFGVGGRRAWELDVLIPRQHGIYQPVGDSVMPGGISRAMRQVPVAVAIARDIAELCPAAIFINYANPMSAIARAIRKATGVNVLGLCHGVNHVQSYLAEMAGLPAREVAMTYIGVNHCTWITEFRHHGQNAWPRINAALAAQPPALPIPGEPFSNAAPFSWELYQLYGAFPAVLDRHVTEFYPDLCHPGAYYGVTLGMEAFSFEGTIARGDANFARMAAVARGDAELDPNVFAHAPGEHEQLVTILGCLWGAGRGVFSVNLPNAGRVPGVPDDAILEGNSYIDENGVRVLSVGNVPLALRDQIARRAAITELTVDAALSGDPRLMAQAILADGATAHPHVARTLANELLKAQAEFVPNHSDFDAVGSSRA